MYKNRRAFGYPSIFLCTNIINNIDTIFMKIYNGNNISVDVMILLGGKMRKI